MTTADYEVKSEQRGGHWVAWVVRTPDGKPEGAILLVGRTRKEAEARVRDWADGKVG